MADKVTFDFGTGEIIFDTPGQKGMEIDPDFREKREAIMAAAGYGQTTVNPGTNVLHIHAPDSKNPLKIGQRKPHDSCGYIPWIDS